MIILYPNNKAYHDFRSQECVGSNETFGIPSERKAPSGKNLEDAETYHSNGERIKAFYTHKADKKIRTDFTIRNSKRSNAINSLLERVEKKQAIL